MQKLTLNIKGMKDADCETKIVDNLKKLEGIFLINVDFKQESGVITFDEEKIKPITIAKAIKALGYDVTANIASSIISSGYSKKKKLNVPKIVFGAMAALSLCVIGLEVYEPTRTYIASHLQADKKTGLEVLQEQSKSTSTADKSTAEPSIKSTSGTEAVAPDSKTDTAPVVAKTSDTGEVQTVTAELGDSGKLPNIDVKAGIPVEFNLHVKDDSLISATGGKVILATFKVEQNLYVGDNVIKFTPSTKGTFDYNDATGKLKAKIKVD